MPEDLLLRMMDLQGYSFERGELLNGEFHVWARDDRRWVDCPRCHQLARRHDVREVTLTERPALGHKTVLRVWRPRFRCSACHALITAEVGVREEGFRLTRLLAGAVIEAAREAPVKFVAALCHLSWNTVT
ncbi:transposase family protein [Candidatus Sumerlaeota bacterium]|nr:transposase family protein [Candidatus Sumerlaeota bacterium]